MYYDKLSFVIPWEKFDQDFAIHSLFSVALLSIIVLVYGLLARCEEKRVLEQIWDEYLTDWQQIPMFLSRMGQ